ncbi:MAG TPA: hypothetical protein QGF58_01585, partial [Myxococcota bacterium]|nr:hypothetical protein [Myxococcota bacterium]
SVTWTEAHAEGVLHLRAHAKSGRWSELENTVLSTTGWRPTARQPRQEETPLSQPMMLSPSANQKYEATFFGRRIIK